MGKIGRQIFNNMPLTRVLIGTGKIENGIVTLDKNKKFMECRALIDSGATNIYISKKVINQLNLIPIAKSKFNSVSQNNNICNLYETVIGVSLNETHENINGKLRISGDISAIPIIVSGNEEIEHENFDMLLGMDVIMRGHLTISGNFFIFSI